jgi:uncharacterized membrane protein YhaH (DUF805 family)
MSNFLKFKSARINRIEYLSLSLFSLLIMLIIHFAPNIILLIAPDATNFSQQLPGITRFLTALWFLLTLSIFAAYKILLGIKRLHDLNHSSWFMLLAVLALVPIIRRACIAGEIYLLCASGTKGKNRFDEQPQPASSAHKITLFTCIFLLIITITGLGILGSIERSKKKMLYINTSDWKTFTTVKEQGGWFDDFTSRYKLSPYQQGSPYFAVRNTVK